MGQPPLLYRGSPLGTGPPGEVTAKPIPFYGIGSATTPSSLVPTSPPRLLKTFQRRTHPENLLQSNLPAMDDACSPRQNRHAFLEQSHLSLCREQLRHDEYHNPAIADQEMPAHQRPAHAAAGSACEQNIPPSAVLR